MSAATLYGQVGNFQTLGFSTVAGTNQAVVIDELRINLGPVAGTPSYNIGNIALAATATTVPEPSSLVLIGLGLAGVMAALRRKVRSS